MCIRVKKKNLSIRHTLSLFARRLFFFSSYTIPKCVSWIIGESYLNSLV